MATYKNIRIKKKGGGFRMQRVQVLANGKYKFVKNKKTSATKSRRPTSRKRSSPKKTTRRRTPTARRKTNSRRKKTTSISILGDIAPLGYGYQTISGRPIGELVTQLIGAMMDGQTDIASVLMNELNATLSNVTANPVGVGVRTALGIWFFKEMSKLVGRRQIFKVGKYRLTA